MLRLPIVLLSVIALVAVVPSFNGRVAASAVTGHVAASAGTSHVAASAGASHVTAQNESTPTLDAARARWERLSPQEKARLQKNYEQYRALTEEERRNLAHRARRLGDERERVKAELPPEAREKLQQLDPEKRREVMRDLVESEVRERGARIREKMPEAWIQRLEEAKPEDRARFLAEFQQRARERVTLAAIDKIGRKLELPRDETERMKALPSAERAAALLELNKRLPAKEAERFGLPAGITQAQWNEWQTLPPAEFFEVMQRYRRERERELGHESPAGGALREINEALRPRADDVVQLADLAPAERRARMFELRRDRVVRVVREHRLLPPDKIAKLELLKEGAFLRALRDFVLRPLTSQPAPTKPPK